MEWEVNVISIQKNKALNKENANCAWICNHLLFVLFHYYENCCNLLGKKTKVFLWKQIVWLMMPVKLHLTEESDAKQFGCTTSWKENVLEFK